MTIKLRIIRPSSREKDDLLHSRLAPLAVDGFEILYEDLPADSYWQYVSADKHLRAQALESALTEAETVAVLCARGGYGASDLLPLLHWQNFLGKQHKLLIGFSDISALHSALYTKLGWYGLHAPMPATQLWGKDGEYQDIEVLKNIIRDLASKKFTSAAIPIEGPTISTSGTLFGGCFTVLTNLIGTPYFPTSLAGKIVFLEDTDEHPARLMRALNQWIQSGSLSGVRALIIGHLRNLGENIPDCASFVYDEFAKRTCVPTFRSSAFGHTSPNYPLMVGASAKIEQGKLTWNYDGRPIA